MVRLIVALALVAAAVCACGSTSSGGVAPPSPTPITTPPAGFDVLVTERDRALTVRAGQKIVVALTRRSGMTLWGPIRVEDSTVLGTAPIDFMAPRDVTVAAFVALSAGTTTITSTAGAQCSSGQPCPQYAMLVSVAVTVT